MKLIERYRNWRWRRRVKDWPPLRRVVIGGMPGTYLLNDQQYQLFQTRWPGLVTVLEEIHSKDL